MGLITSWLQSVLAEPLLEREYAKDQSKGFSELMPIKAYVRANAAVYLQPAVRSLEDEALLKVALPREAKLPRGWDSIWNDYVLIDSVGKLYGCLTVENLMDLGVKVGDNVHVTKEDDNDEFYLNVYSPATWEECLQIRSLYNSCDVFEFTVPESMCVTRSIPNVFENPLLCLLPVPEGSKAKPHIGIYDKDELIFDINARAGSYRDLLDKIELSIAAIKTKKCNSVFGSDPFYPAEIFYEHLETKKGA